MFAGFIVAAREMSLRERQVWVYAQRALLHLYLVEKQLFEGPSWNRPPIREAALVFALERDKSEIFRRSRIGQEQRADQIVAAMENYYRILLSDGGLKPEDVDSRVRSAFGRTKLIVATAVDGLRTSVHPMRARFERTRAIVARASRAGLGKSSALRAARPMIENGNAELLRFVREIAGNAGTGKDDDAHRHDLEHTVVALERSGLTVAGPIGLERDLRDAALVGPAGGGLLGAFGRAAMDEHHVRMLGVDLVKHGPDAFVVVELNTAREGDLGACRHE